MANFQNLIAQYQNRIAVYGLSTETERFLCENVNISVLGLLDGFCTDGEMYGYPIISLDSAVAKGVKLIIVVARPGSCKAIAKRIGNVCKEKGIFLFDVRGKNLLEHAAVSYAFDNVPGGTREELLRKIARVDIVSFDLFDTLVMRKVLHYTDIYALMDIELRRQGIYIPDFAQLRLAEELILSQHTAPTLQNIYEAVLRKTGGAFIMAEDLTAMEWKIDLSVMVKRAAVCDVFRCAVSAGKRVIVTTDSYYGEMQIAQILEKFDLTGYERLFVSCEVGTAKSARLFDEVISYCGNSSVLHIGNDDAADIIPAQARGLETFRLYSGVELFDELGGMGTEKYISTLSDKIKVGFFISRMFNNPFAFETKERKVTISKSYDIGYIIYAPIITDFVFWLKRKFIEHNISWILFCARDGYLIGRLYQKIDKERRAIYFLTSRIAAIRAGIRSESDIDNINKMKYSGTQENCFQTRFGVVYKADGNSQEYLIKKAIIQSENYKAYINKFSIGDENLGVIDFVAKGTTQYYLQRLFPQHLKNFYFLQLEPEYMAKKDLDIEPFFIEAEKNTSSIFENYYVLETVLTSPYPSVHEFDNKGMPIFASETRNENNLKYIKEAQNGIFDYFREFTSLIPENEREENKNLDEVFLSLISKICITNEDFLSLIVEDPFFGRNTPIKDIIG